MRGRRTRWWGWCVLVALLAQLALRGVAGATDGDLAPTFGNGGIARVAVGDGRAVTQAQAMVRQASGKLVVVGQVRSGVTLTCHASGLVRFNVDGSLDTTFGVGGTVTLGVGDSLFATDLIELANGKLVVVGYNTTLADGIVVARYLPDGQPDTTFGTAGLARAPVALARAIVEQADGDLVIAAFSSTSTAGDLVLVRLKSDGQLDSAFGNAGVVRTNVASSDRASDLLVQPDGKIVVGGSTVPSSVSSNFALVRYHPDGSLDASFGNGGFVVTNIGAQSDAVNSLVLQADGKLVAAGYAMINTNDEDFAVVRYNADGSLDPTFGTGGITTLKVGTGADRAQEVIALAGGGFAAVGYATFAGGARFAVARFTADGQLAAGFGTNGVVTTDVSSASDPAFAIVEQPDGRLIAAGASDGASGDVTLVRYQTTGALDASFGSGGIASTFFTLYCDWAHAVAEQADGKLVVVGRGDGTGDDFGVARLTADGALDASFGTGGRVLTSLSSAGEDLPHAVLVQPDGKVVVAGKYYLSGLDTDFGLVRYQPNGALDTTFGSGGIVRTAMTTSLDDIRAMLRQPDGKLVVAGWCNVNSAFLLARYTATGALDSTFGTGGKVSTGTGNTSSAYALARQSDGKLIVAGESTLAGQSGSVIALVRLNANGTIDGSFGSGGMVNTSIDTGTEVARALVLQPDGKPVVAGYAGRNGTVEIALVRYTASGALDGTFGNGGIVTTHFDSGRAFGYALTRQRDGKLVVAASVEKSTQVFDGVLVRYLADGSLDTSFGDGGVRRYPGLLFGNEIGQAVLQTAGGDLVMVGHSLDAEGSRKFTVGRVQVAVCGNGVREEAEACDEGAANGGASCCSVECSLRPVDEVCRPSLGACDVDERCDGASALCPADVAPVCTATATPSATATATPTATATGTATPSSTETFTDTPTVSATPTATATATATVTASSTATATGTATPSSTETFLDTPTVTSTPTASDTATPTATATSSSTKTATDSATASATAMPTASATDTPSPTATPGVCPAQARAQCRDAGTSQLLIQKGSTSGGDRVSWKWLRGAATAAAELGDPVQTTSYALCLYTGAEPAAVPGWALRVPPHATRWRRVGSSGFRYSDPQGTSDGVSAVVLRASATSPKLLLKGKGDGLPEITLPLLDLPLTVQWSTDDPAAPCWQSVFTEAAVVGNDARKLKLKAR